MQIQFSLLVVAIILHCQQNTSPAFSPDQLLSVVQIDFQLENSDLKLGLEIVTLRFETLVVTLITDLTQFGSRSV